MNNILSFTPVMKRDGRIANIFYWILVIIVALALFVAAAGAGPEDYIPANPLEDWFNVAANIVCVIFGFLVLIPRTRIIGALFGVIYMFGAMYINYTVAGVDFFVSAIPYNTISLTVSSILVGHYFEDLAYVFKVSGEEQKALNRTVQISH
ncbi:MAG: hypothetical protein AAF846_22780 [Chloroflexota bacterium]